MNLTEHREISHITQNTESDGSQSTEHTEVGALRKTSQNHAAQSGPR